MQITIELPECYVKRLSNWASVSRTLNESKRIVEDSNDENAEMNARELEDITQALDALHSLVRNQLWIKQQ